MAFIAAPVAAWAIGAGASAAVGALAGAIAVGVVTGAVMGAAMAVITGQNILEGALKGALIGGISGGVMSGLGMAAGFSSSTSQLASMGLSPTGAALSPAAGVGSGVGSTIGASGEAIASPMVQGGTGAIDVATASPAFMQAGGVSNVVTGAEAGLLPKTQSAERGFFDKLLFDNSGNLNAGAGKVLSSGVEGAAKALLTDDDKPESQSEYIRQVQAMNVAGDFQSRTANIKIPDSWKQYNKIQGPNLNPGTSAKLTPIQINALTAQQQGGAYAQPV